MSWISIRKLPDTKLDDSIIKWLLQISTLPTLGQLTIAERRLGVTKKDVNLGLSHLVTSQELPPADIIRS
jgi:hypothetical protein